MRARGGEAGLDRAGVTGEGEEGPSGRGAGGGALGDTRSLGGGGPLSAPGEGPVPRQGSAPKATLWDRSGSPEERRDEGAWRAGAPGGCRQEPGGRGAPLGQGVGPRVPVGK